MSDETKLKCTNPYRPPVGETTSSCCIDGSVQVWIRIPHDAALVRVALIKEDLVNLMSALVCTALTAMQLRSVCNEVCDLCTMSTHLQMC